MRRDGTASTAEIGAMFDRIAPIYDAMNTLMTAGLDARWRRAAAAATALRTGGSALDLACGSGALTRTLARAVGPTGSVVGVDISPSMLARARRRSVGAEEARPSYLCANAVDLPVGAASVDAATIAFGLRNVAERERCLAEMVRVTRRGGRVVVLELVVPDGGVGRLVDRIWLGSLVPVIGRLAGGGSAYAYLPASMRTYPEPNAVARMMTVAGLRDVAWRRLWPGLVTLHAGTRA